MVEKFLFAAVEILTSPTSLPLRSKISDVSLRSIRPRTLDWLNQIAGTLGRRVYPVDQNMVAVSNCRLRRRQDNIESKNRIK